MGVAALASCTPDAMNEGIESNLSDVVRYENGSIIPNQYIVVLRSQGEMFKTNPQDMSFDEAQRTVQQAAEDITNRNNLSAGKIAHVYGKAIVGFSMELTQEELVRLKEDDAIDYIESDKFIALAPGGKGKPGGGGGTAPQVTPWGITRVGGAADGTGLRAWIIDSGIDQDHPDLNVNTALSQSFLSGNQSTNPDDQNGHGTHVAGTVAAIDNAEGVVGVAAGAEVVSVRVLDRRGNGSLSGVIAGVNYVAGNASSNDVANMSLGGGISTSLDAAVLSASSACPFVLAAGNDGIDANNSSPARVNGPNIYTVSATDANDNFAYFSNYGNPPVDYAAPGVSIESTYKGGGYSTLSGTSMAAPHVAGIVLLGNVNSSGSANNDPDGNADPIAHQ
ncbi:S8 family serine peptidase [Phaeocystidibacter luteus]|uniref:S8 family serine peptidase n=2 Tax=Phaeocystidibacter luteus TaxID=911197 RepID=A0A6N6RKY6_9FLAO|nr:S8 family serine peptidase [Phaeocystidibacter luteus]